MYKRQVLTSLELAQRLFNYPDRVSSLVVRLAPGADAERVRRAVAEEAGDGFRVRTRDELRASFYRIMTCLLYTSCSSGRGGAFGSTCSTAGAS